MVTTPEPETDDLGSLRRTCFVIMPFGEKIDVSGVTSASAAGSTPGSSTVQLMPGAVVPHIDFNRIYDLVIKPAVSLAAARSGVDIDCIRSDEVGHSGFIHHEMLAHVAGADIAIVDITTQNANVFYELGVRHSFRRSTTILIRRDGTHIPFNISGMRVFPYSDEDSAKIEASKERLAETIATSTRQKENDSLVHHLLPNTSVVRESWPIMESRHVWYDVLTRKGELISHMCLDGTTTTQKSVGFITGDLLNVMDVDVWANPENTKMQMARYHDGSISSNIRYYGAHRTQSGHVVDDIISEALKGRMQGTASVEPGVVLMTTPGMLGERNRVKMIAHVAALQGEPGKGYQPIRNYPGCVQSVLTEVDRLNELSRFMAPRRLFGGGRGNMPAGAELHGLGCETVLFPLFGTRSFGQHPQTVTENLFRAAAVYLEQNPSSKIHTVYFLAYSEQDRELCERALGLLQSLNRVKRPDPSRPLHPQTR